MSQPLVRKITNSLIYIYKMKIKKRYIICVVILFGYIGLPQDESCACCTENHKAFDFWIGKWTVTNPDGTAAGNSLITKSERDCVIRENWVSAKGGYTGTSTNFYNRISGQWEQLWIDNSGVHLKLKGNGEGNQMILSSDEFKDSTGTLVRNRITWTLNKDGTIRQLWEILKGEKVVSTAFDGIYRKMK